VIVRFLSVAELEASEAALQYEDRQAGLGEQLLTEHALERIRRDPRYLGTVEGFTGPHELRRCLLHRFPYIVVFMVKADEVVIVAVGDARRVPFYWLDRLT